MLQISSLGPGTALAARLTHEDTAPYNQCFTYLFENFRGITDNMANHVSALKRARQTERRTAVNRANKSRLRNALRAFRESLAKADKKAAEAHFRTTASLIDKAIQKGTIHGNTAARYKSRLSARLNALAK